MYNFTYDLWIRDYYMLNKFRVIEKGFKRKDVRDSLTMVEDGSRVRSF